MDVTTSARIKPVSAIPTGKITINGVEISRAAIAQEMQHHPADKPGDAWREAARALAIRELLLQQARELALRPEPLTDTEGRRETDEEALVRGVIDHDVITPEPNAVACRRYYEQNLRRFRSPDLREVDHILLAAAPRRSKRKKDSPGDSANTHRRACKRTRPFRVTCKDAFRMSITRSWRQSWSNWSRPNSAGI